MEECYAEGSMRDQASLYAIQVGQGITYLRSPDGVAVAKIQEAFRKRRAYAKSKLTIREYLKLLVVMLTEGHPLCMEIESLYSKYTTMTALKNPGPRTDVRRLFTRIYKTRNALFQASAEFNALNLAEEGLRKRISEGMSLVGEARKILKSVDGTRREEILKRVESLFLVNKEQITTSHGPSQAPKPAAGGNKDGGNKADSNKTGGNQAGSDQASGDHASGSKANGDQVGGKKAGGNKKGGNKKGSSRRKYNTVKERLVGNAGYYENKASMVNEYLN